MTTTFDGIRAIIVRDFELPPEQLLRDTLLTDIELDSLAITELVFTIEDEFQITAENTIPPFKTLGDLADYVARLIAERDTKPRATAKSAAVPTMPSKAAAAPATATPPRSGAKKIRSAGNRALGSGKRSGGARKANGKTDKHANGKSRANGASAGGTGGASPKRAAKRPARAAPGDGAPGRKPKGRAGARAR